MAQLLLQARTRAADIIAISRGIVVKAMAILGIPILFGIDIIWIAPLVAEFITLILAIWLSKKTKLEYK